MCPFQQSQQAEERLDGLIFRPFILHLGLQWSSLTLKNSAVANLVEGSILSVTLQWADLLVLL